MVVIPIVDIYDAISNYLFITCLAGVPLCQIFSMILSVDGVVFFSSFDKQETHKMCTFLSFASASLHLCFLISLQLSYSSDLSVNAVKIFEVLVNYLVTEHIDYAVELGLLGKFFISRETS